MIKKIILLTLIITTTITTFFFSMQTPDELQGPDFALDLFGVFYGINKPKANHYYKSEEWSPFSSPITSPRSSKRRSANVTSGFLEESSSHYTNSPHFEVDALLQCPVWAESEKEHLKPLEVARYYAGTCYYLAPEEKTQLAEASSSFIENIADFVYPIKSGMRIFQLLKAKNYRTFILSNIPYECKEGMHTQKFLAQCQTEIPGYIDPFSSSVEEIYSIDTKHRKPDQHIYEILLASGNPTFGSSSFGIFIDDSYTNLKAAAAAGIFSISCHTHAELYLTTLTLGLIDRDETAEYLLNDEEELKILRTLQYGKDTKSLNFYINALVVSLNTNQAFIPEVTSDPLDQALEQFDCEVIIENLARVFGKPTIYGDPTRAYQFARLRKEQKQFESESPTTQSPLYATGNTVANWLSPV